MDSTKVTVLRDFLDGADYARAGAVIEVPELRARELQRNGLVTREVKLAEPAANKMAAEPKNKGRKHDPDA